MSLPNYKSLRKYIVVPKITQDSKIVRCRRGERNEFTKGQSSSPASRMEPARFWIQENVYYTYACKQSEGETGEGNLLKTPRQPVLCPGSFSSPEAVAHHGAEICDVCTAVLPGAGILTERLETVPADHGPTVMKTKLCKCCSEFSTGKSLQQLLN